jgi:hypothetical protein
MDYDEAAIGLMRLAAMIGDAHTSVNLPSGSGLTFPLRLREFDGGFWVVAVAPGLEKALGAHLLKIDETPVEDACKSLSALDAQDEHPWLRRAMSATQLISTRLLHGVGIIPVDTAARYTFAADDGAEFSLPVKAQSLDQQAQTVWVTAVKQLAYAWEPMHRVNDTFTYTWLPTDKAVYCNIRSIRDLSRPAKKLLDFVKESGLKNSPSKMHLRPGSLRVKAGERVRRGQVLAGVGCSGDAREPHLHFEVTDSSKPLAGEGMPYVIDWYSRTGVSGTPTEIRRRELPLNGSVVAFSGEHGK